MLRAAAPLPPLHHHRSLPPRPQAPPQPESRSFVASVPQDLCCVRLVREAAAPAAAAALSPASVHPGSLLAGEPHPAGDADGAEGGRGGRGAASPGQAPSRGRCRGGVGEYRPLPHKPHPHLPLRPPPILLPLPSPPASLLSAFLPPHPHPCLFHVQHAIIFLTNPFPQ